MTQIEMDYETIVTALRLCSLIPTATVRAIIREIDRMDTLMPIIDPTTYNAKARTWAKNRELVAAFLSLREAIDAQRGQATSTPR